MASISQGRTAAAQCGLFTHKSVPVIFEPPCSYMHICTHTRIHTYIHAYIQTCVHIQTFIHTHIYRIRDKQNLLLDHEAEQEDWTHPADSVRICEHKESKDSTIHKYRDGSKNELGVGSEIALYTKNKLTYLIKHKPPNRCSNNHAEQTAILKTHYTQLIQ